jgi:molybdopterin-guanine dinucleotide biosynthesis protein A
MHGLILAGGRATRMGGGDKPLRRLGPCSLLDHVIARLAPQVQTLAISANGDPARFAPRPFAVIADAVPGRGPLGGMLAGLRWAHSCGAHRLLIAPGDTPFLPPDLGARLGAPRAAIACAASAGRDHPTVALLATALADDLETAMAAGARSVRDWMSRHGPARVEWDIVGGDPFQNINTPAELAAAEAIATGGARTLPDGLALT